MLSTNLMYAARKDSSLYHLVDNRRTYTLCGLRIVRVPTAGYAFAVLRILKERPEDKKLCSRCERVAGARNPVH
ncbi:MAG TPA: hypothetical protein VJT50_08075 [Pyrinomonadaceae bacterium]|nr:hypothetical protein [Pyrinomonadaceae bacterium]